MVSIYKNLSQLLNGYWQIACLMLLFIFYSQVEATPVSYIYDDLNRITQVNYGDGQQIITYSYDAAGNILSRVVDEGQAPLFSSSAH